MPFPAETNTLASVSSSQSLAAGGHAARHNELKAAIESIRDILGGSSQPTGTISVTGNTATDLVRITQTGAGNALVVEDSANPDATPFVINATGNLVTGATTVRSDYFNGAVLAPRISVEGSGAASWIAAVRNSADTGAAALLLGKSRGTSAGGVAVVSSGDEIGLLSFQAADGTDLVEAARISAVVDGTPGSNDMPGRLVFSTTADGASSPTERMRITSAGTVGIGTTSPGKTLDVSGQLRIGNPLGSGYALLEYGSSATATNNWHVGSEGDGTFRFYNGVFGAGTERMRIDSSGNVGIGTSSPSTALHVKAAWVTNEGQISADVTSGGRYSGMTVQNDGTLKGLMVWDNTDSRLCLSLPGTSGLISLGPNSTNLGLVYDGTNNRMQFYSQDGTERLRVDSAGLITGTGTSLGAWTSYTPTLAGTGWAIGNGTISGFYCQIGKMVHIRGSILFGSTSTYGAGVPTVSLPVTAKDAAQVGTHLTQLIDASLSATNIGVLRPDSTTAMALNYLGTNGAMTAVSSTAPFTWASSDAVRFVAYYEIA